MKFLKRFSIIFFSLLFLVFATVFILVRFYKKELADVLVQELKTKHHTIFKTEDVSVSLFDNWPHVSVDFKNVEIRSTLAPMGLSPLVKAGSIAVGFDLMKLIHGSFVARYLSIHNSEIFFQRDADGNRNFVFQDSLQQLNPADTVQTKKENISFELKTVNLKNCHFVFHNEQREQRIDLTVEKSNILLKNFIDGVKADFKSECVIKGLMFNRRKGIYLQDANALLDFKLGYFFQNRSLCVFPESEITIDKQIYAISGVTHFEGEKKLMLSITGKQADLKKVRALLTSSVRRALSNFEVKKPLDVSMILSASLDRREEPAFVVRFAGKNQEVSIGKSKVPYSELDFIGRIVSLDSTHTKGDFEKAYILVSPLRGKIYQHPFTAKVLVSGLKEPQIEAEAEMKILAENIEFKVAKDFMLQGSATAHINYSGPAAKLNSLEFLDKPMKLKARISFKKLSYRKFNSPYPFVLNGSAILNNRDLYFDSLSLKTVVGDARLKGRAEGFMPYVLGYSPGFKANLSAKSEYIDLNPLIMKNKGAASAHQSKEKGMQSKMQDAVSNGLSHFDFNVQLFAKNMLMRQVQAANVASDLNFKSDMLTIKSLSLATCEGKVFVNGTIKEFSKVKVNLKVDNVNVTTLFRQCENFGQDVIKSENLKGLLSFDSKLSTELDDHMEVIGETMSADVKLILREGHLLNFGPFQKMTGFILKIRDLNDVAFSELNENFELRGYKMRIHELEIASSVLNLYVVDGLYDFKGYSNINVLVPWNNLKKRNKDYVPKNSGESAQNTRGIKLNFSGPKNQVKLSLGHKSL